MVCEKMERLGRRRSVIREIYEYGNTRRAEIGAENVFDFSLGNPSVPAPREVGEVLMRLLTEEEPYSLHGYTSAEGDADVRRAIADHIAKTHRSPAAANLIYLTVGAASALAISLRALLSDGGEVAVFTPYFPEYRVFIEAAGGRTVEVPLREGDFMIDPSRLAAALTERTRAVIVNSPNNPTGTVLTEENIRAFTAVLREAEERFGHPIYLIADEPYRELVYGDITVPYLPNYYPDTLVVYSFSKSLSLPGERIGYIAVSPNAADAETVYAAVMGAGRALGYVCAPSIFQKMIPHLLGKTADLTVYRKNRDRLYTALTDYGYECVRPDGAFYLFVRALEEDAAAFCERAKRHELLLVPSDGFGCTGYVRIAYCVTPEQIERSLPAFYALAQEYKNGERL